MIVFYPRAPSLYCTSRVVRTIYRSNNVENINIRARVLNANNRLTEARRAINVERFSFSHNRAPTLFRYHSFYGIAFTETYTGRIWRAVHYTNTAIVVHLRTYCRGRILGLKSRRTPRHVAIVFNTRKTNRIRNSRGKLLTEVFEKNVRRDIITNRKRSEDE